MERQFYSETKREWFECFDPAHAHAAQWIVDFDSNCFVMPSTEQSAEKK